MAWDVETEVLLKKNQKNNVQFSNSHPNKHTHTASKLSPALTVALSITTQPVMHG